jgi:hypothetical protein
MQKSIGLISEHERLNQANEFIKVIASCGRQFLNHDGFISFMELSQTKRVFFVDHYTRKSIYTHRKYVVWRGFTAGGTMKSLVEALRDYIKTGKPLRLSYFQDDMGNGFKNPWGYGEDLAIVKDAAQKLGIAK